jgi:hypothetical protein
MIRIFEILILTIAITVSLFLFFYLADTVLSPGFSQDLENKVCFGEKCFLVKIAKTDFERRRGLMFQKELGEEMGMLFIFDKENIYSFWMKNTLIPLDMIWIDKNNKVVFINENSQPCGAEECPLISPNVKAKYVLEINAGVSKGDGIKIGDIVDLSAD